MVDNQSKLIRKYCSLQDEIFNTFCIEENDEYIFRVIKYMNGYQWKRCRGLQNKKYPVIKYSTIKESGIIEFGVIDDSANSRIIEVMSDELYTVFYRLAKIDDNENILILMIFDNALEER